MIFMNELSSNFTLSAERAPLPTLLVTDWGGCTIAHLRLILTAAHAGLLMQHADQIECEHM